MKKLLVLSVLLGLLALPVFAEHATIDFGGDDTFGFITDFGAYAESLDLTWDVMVGIDDYNSFTWSLKDIDAQGNIVLDKALTTTDIGMWLGLPVGLKVMWGYDDPDANEFGNVTGYENTQSYDFSPAEYWGLAFMVSASFLEVELAFDPDGAAGTILAGLALKEPIPGLNAEVYYFQGHQDGTAVAADEYGEGQLGIGAAYAAEVAGAALEAGLVFHYVLDDAFSDFGGAWAWGFGVAGEYSILEASLGIGGYDGETVSGMDFTVDVHPVDKASLYAGAVINFVDGFDTFQGADLGAAAHVGAVDVYVGYLITSNGAGDYNAPTTLTDGGFYMKFDVDY
jgi:hypothetical protein